MRRFRLVFVALAILAVCLPVAALAKEPEVVNTYTLAPEIWQPGYTDEHGVYVPCTYDRPEAPWTWATGGTEVEKLSDSTPVQLDPKIRQNILNSTETDVWTDWHVKIENAQNLRDVIVRKSYPSTFSWTVAIDTYPAGSNAVGFFAHLQTMGDPSNPQAIRPGDKLYVEFTYDVVSLSSPVNVIQYPTADYPIPEPSSIMALVTGLGALGFTVRRRR